MAGTPQPEPPDVRILALAASHIRRHGARRTTVVAIAAEAGMSHANIYRYFPSKEALIEAVTENWLKPLEASLREIADAPDPAYDKIERLAAAVQSVYRDKLETDPNLFAVFAEAAGKGLGVARRHRNRLQQEVQRIVEEGISNGVFALADQRRALTLFFDSLHRFIHPIAVQLDVEAPRNQINARFERVIQMVISVLIRGKI